MKGSNIADNKSWLHFIAGPWNLLGVLPDRKSTAMAHHASNVALLLAPIIEALIAANHA